ncbi:kinase-like domain-containing protein [Aspergillus cavernicola]|uniref:non-specific serine/threonine protein kinase n=1 Tax=Aspergillus cavernicola TaxID=176166 RepID=A0ABR4HS12_9EURO
MIGDMLHERYRIIDKLGYGSYSTPSSVTHPGRDSIFPLLDEFEVTGPNGTHPCYTRTPARCELQEVSSSRLFPLEVTRALSAGLTLAIAYIHSQGYAHADIRLQNVLVKLPSSLDHFSPEVVSVTQCDGHPLPPNVPEKGVTSLYFGKNAEEFSLSDSRILLSDLGEAFAPGVEARRGEDSHGPLAWRPPEARFKPQAPLSYSADIWSLAATIWEIIGMKTIVSCHFATADEVLGPISVTWWERWEEWSQFFDDAGYPLDGRDVWPPLHDAFEQNVQKLH